MGNTGKDGLYAPIRDKRATADLELHVEQMKAESENLSGRRDEEAMAT